MGPFGSDTKRYDMHYMCHSTSICRFWGPFFTFQPLSSIIFMKIVFTTPPPGRSYSESFLHGWDAHGLLGKQNMSGK